MHVNPATGAAALAPLNGRGVDQLGFLVRDLDEAVERWSRTFGLGPWLIYRYAPDTVPTLNYRDGPGRFSLRLALSAGRPQIELIQPLEGPCVYDGWIEQRGEGLHHVATIVDSIETVRPELEAAGHPLVQWGGGYGLDGDGGFAYFDTVGTLGLWTELIELPARRRPPLATR